MKQKLTLKRFISSLLCAAMVTTYMPSAFFSAFAEDGSSDEKQTIEEPVKDQDSTKKDNEGTGRDAPDVPAVEAKNSEAAAAPSGEESKVIVENDSASDASEASGNETRAGPAEGDVNEGSDDPEEDVVLNDDSTQVSPATEEPAATETEEVKVETQEAEVKAEAPEVLTEEAEVKSETAEAKVDEAVVKAEAVEEADEAEKADEAKDANEEETWTVTFYNRDAEVYKVVKVTKGEAIGSAIPAAIPREDYIAHWAIGTIVQGGQGKEIKVTGSRIGSGFVPEEDTEIVPVYDKITRTVYFYESKDAATAYESRTVDADTSYCLNNIPAVPAKEGSHGKWVYDDGDFNNQVTVTDGMKVWAEYDQTVFTVKFMVGSELYDTDTYYSGDSLKLPSNPVAEGKQFSGWFIGDTEYKGGEKVTSDLEISAKFDDEYYVRFVVDRGDGTEEQLSQYFRTEGEAIGTMPQDPFVSGKIFEKWVVQGTDTEVTADTVVKGNMIVEAVFRTVSVYNITAEYYYLNDRGNEVIFNTDLMQVEAHELPYTITAPATTQTSPDEVSGAPIYYPETPTVTVKESDFTDGAYTVRFKYVPYTAEYDFVYMLKNLDGEGYTEIDRTSSVQGVLNSYVTPVVKNFDYAILERAEGAEITQASGQELNVYYTRKNFQVTYETSGGSYVGGATVPYGTDYEVSSTVPTKDGFDFDGWYLDEELEQEAGSSITVTDNTTLYAKWSPKRVNYTIVYMFEKYNDTGSASSYVYDNSRNGTGTVGSTVQASSAPAISRTGWEADTAKNSSSSVVIAADGSSVLYVYYKLRSYTLSFNRKSVGWIIRPNGTTTTGTYSFTTKLGEDISTKWPSADSNNWYFTGWQKNGQGARYITKQLIMNTELLPASGTSVTYYADWSYNANQYTVNYYLQNADDNGYTRSATYSQTYYSDSDNLNPKTISGYTFVRRNDSGRTFNFYYDRDKFNIDYYYGSTKLDTISNVKFDANINKAPYTWTPTAVQCGVDSDYTFAGWYADSGLTSEYTFTTMPASNLVLYAKWTAPKFNVNFVDEDGTTVLADAQEVEKYSKAVKPTNPEKEGYTFDGWFTSADGSEMFDWNTQVTEDITVYAHWTKNTLSYTVKYVDEKGNALAAEKTVSNPNFTVGQEITEYAIAIAGYRPEENTLNLTLTGKDSENVITFIYSQKSDKTSYTVRYIIDSSEPAGGTAVAEEKIVEDVPGNTSSVIEMAAAVDYAALYAAHPELTGIEFYPDEAEKTLILTAHEEKNVLTFTYSSFRHAEVTVHYIDMDGKKIAGDHVEKLKIGKTFTLSRTPITGWELNKAVVGNGKDGEEAGTNYKITEAVTEDGLEFTLVYQKKVTITAASASKQYDGDALTLPENDKIKVEGLIDGHRLTSIDFDYADTDSDDPIGRVNAGIATVTPKAAEISGPRAANYYSIRYISGTLEVTKINVTIRIEPDRWTGAQYNGEVYKAGFTNPNKGIADYVLISHDGYKETYLNDIWDTVKAKATYDESAVGLKYVGIEKKDAGDYTYNIEIGASELPKNDNYSVSIFVRPGRLQILPAEATVKTGSGSKGYDGKALTNAEASITGLIAADEGKVTVKATGSQTEIGSSSNTYSIDWGSIASSNYSITEDLGTLTVTKGSVTLTAASDSKTYDGTALTNSGVTASSLPEGFTVEATASGSQTDAGESANVVNDGAKFFDKDGVDRTDWFEVTQKVDGKLTVDPAQVTVTTGSASKAYDGTALTNAEAEIKGLVNGETATVTATGSQTEVGSGSNTYSISWGSANKDNYTITENLGTLTVTESSVEVVLTAASDSKTYDGKALTNASVEASGLPEGFTFEATASGSQTDAGESANVVDDGYKFFDANGNDKTSNFKNVAKVDGKLTVNPAAVTVKTGSDSKEYDGTALTNAEAEITGLVNGEEAEITATGSQTEVGESSNTYSISWGTANKDNYSVTENLGTLTVTTNSAEVTLKAASDSKTYDGKALTNASVEASGLPEGFKVEATASGSQTDAGESENVVNDGYVIKDAEGNDKTANFTNVKKVDGTLTVDPAPVTITTGSGSKEYDGTALTNAEAEITGLVNDETAVVTATGSQIEVGESDNSYSIDWGKTNKDNYTVTEDLGTLSVTANDAEVTLTAANDSKTYDGKALTNTDVTAAGLPEGFTAEATASGSQTNAGSSENVVNDGYVIKDAAGNDKTANFTNVKKVDGTLTVDPAPVTITTGSGSKEYDGTALTNKEAGITGLVNGETAVVTATGSQIEVGESKNTYTIDWGTTDIGNYTVTEDLGTLTVTTNSAEVTLTAANDSKTYDGKALTNSDVTAAGLPEGFTAEATASGSQTDAGESANVVNDGYVIKDAAGNDKSANFTNVKKVDGTLTVAPAKVTITTGSGSKAYDGTALTVAEANITGLVNDETAAVTAIGSQTEVGESKNTYSIEWGTAKAENYEITENLGTLTVEKRTALVALTAPSAVKTYDGTALTADGTGDKKVTAQGLPESFTLEATASGSQTDAGESANVVNDGYIIRNAAGEDKTSYFTNIQKVDGKLTVNKAPLKVITGSDSKEYDGKALTKDEAEISGFVNGETAAVTATGSQTEVGTSNNTYSVEWRTAKADNYTIAEELGTLTVRANSKEVTLTAASDSKTYDGKALTNSGVTAAGLPEGFTVEAKASGSQIDAGESANKVNDGYKILDQNKADKTANFTNVKKVDGTLTVTKAPLTVTTGSASKEYDGTVLTEPEAKVAGLVPGEIATAKGTGSQTEVGSSSNTYEIRWINPAKADNYEIIEKLGTLEVKASTAEVVLTAPSASKVYDGTPLTEDGTGEKKVTASGLPAGYTVQATADGSQTDAGTGANKVNDGYKIFDANGADKTASFANVRKADGELIVSKRPVTLTSDSDSKVYDGKALTNKKVTAEGFIGNDGAEYTVTGTQTLVGSSDNTFTYKVKEGTLASNYNFKTVFGTLTVTDGEGPDDEEKVDDGLVVTKTVDNREYSIGSTVTFTISATNIYDEARTITFKELPGVTLAKSSFEAVAAGETVTTTAAYTIKEADILNGSFTNTVTASVGNISKTADATARIEGIRPEVKVSKKADKTRGLREGDTVRYTITIENTGNVTVSGIEVEDSLVRFRGNTGTIESLSPGAKATIRYSYTVTAADVRAGRVINAATATGTTPDGSNPEDEDSITVITVPDDEEGNTPDDVTPDGGNPDGGNTPAVTPDGGDGTIVPVPVDDGTVIPDEPTPEVEPEVDIVDPETPLAAGAWALINLLSAIVTALGAAVALFRRKEKDDEDEDGDDPEGGKKSKEKEDEDEEEDNRGKKMLASKIAGAIAGIAAPITFILTEDMSLPMQMIDKWTLLMLVMLAVQIVAAVLNKKASKLDDDDEEKVEAAAN